MISGLIDLNMHVITCTYILGTFLTIMIYHLYCILNYGKYNVYLKHQSKWAYDEFYIKKIYENTIKYFTFTIQKIINTKENHMIASTGILIIIHDCMKPESQEFGG